MIKYYFYNNIKKNKYRVSPYFILLSSLFEIHNILLNFIYLNRIYTLNKTFSITTESNNCYIFNFYFFFNKIKKLSKFFKKMSFRNKKIKTWKSLIVFFFITINSVLISKRFFDFNFNIKLTTNNSISYSYYNKIILFKIKKKPVRFSFFYFYLFIYRLYLANKYSLLLIKNFIFLNFDFLLFFKLVKYKNHINYKYKYYIYI